MGIVLAALTTLGIVGQSFAEAPALAAGPEIEGAGSSYAAPAIDNWTTQIAGINGDNVNYSVSSSVVGMNLFAEGLVTFGASEIGFSTGQMSYTPKEAYQYLPDVAGATCLMFNVKGRLGNRLPSLNLNSQVLAEIWTGTVTKWNAPQIAALNRGVLLPDAPILAVFRTDASGENYLFTQYLDYLQPSIWRPFVSTLQAGNPVSAVWPTGTRHGKYNLSSFVGQSGSDGASNFVAANNDAVTYVETAYAILHGLPCAGIENANGHYVQPSEQADAVGLERAQLLPDLEQKLQGVYTNPLPGAYPLAAYSYLVTPKGPGTLSTAQGAVLGQFIRFFSCEGQQSAGALGYSPLPPNLVNEDFAAIDRIPGAAKAPPEATASNCSDPYVDGQTPLPGEPCIGSSCSSGGGGTGGGPGGSTSTGGSGDSGGSGGGGGHQTGGGSKDGGGGSKGHSTGTTQPPGSGSGTPSLTGSTLPTANGLWPGEAIVPGARPGASLSNGQTPGYELATADLTLLGVRLTMGTMWLSVLILVMLIALPPTLAARRRRRRRAALGASGAPGPS